MTNYEIAKSLDVYEMAKMLEKLMIGCTKCPVMRECEVKIEKSSAGCHFALEGWLLRETHE